MIFVIKGILLDKMLNKKSSTFQSEIFYVNIEIVHEKCRQYLRNIKENDEHLQNMR